MKQNVKVIANLVRKAKKKLYQNKRDEALELMRKAVQIDDNTGILVQVVKVIGKKKLKTDFDEEPIEVQPDAEPEPEEMETWPSAEPEKEEAVTRPGTTAAKKREQERKPSMSPEEQLDKLFEASDREFESGNQQKAVAYLKRARKIAPDNDEVQSRIDILKIKIKSSNLVQIARKKMETGEEAKAVILSREAFEIMPDAPGLYELLQDLESGNVRAASPPPAAKQDAEPARTAPEPSADSEKSGDDYIVEIRQLVQDNALEKAAYTARKAYSKHPDNSLISEFVDNFRKLGLLD